MRQTPKQMPPLDCFFVLPTLLGGRLVSHIDAKTSLSLRLQLLVDIVQELVLEFDQVLRLLADVTLVHLLGKLG